jgi:DNA-directed RNA polymerase specialized sigma subunit, sigma24 homolog
MVLINLRKYYEFYQQDDFVEVPDEVAEALQQLDRQEASHRRKVYRNKAHFSLDRNDGIEHSVVYAVLSPEDLYEQKVNRELLHAAMATLSGKQAKRIYAHYFLGLSKAEIARTENVRGDTVKKSISEGLHKLQCFLSKT